MGDMRKRRPVLGDYMDWADIDYRPPQQMLPEALVPYLTPNMSVLDVGCHTGTALFYLAEHTRVAHLEGVDLNVRALTQAKLIAENLGLNSRVKFTYGDILDVPRRKQYNAIILTRVFTCFTSEISRMQLVQRCHELLAEGGLIYIRDFMMDPHNPKYKERYQRADTLGWPKGNFGIYHSDRSLQLIVHHHTREELLKMLEGFDVVKNVSFRHELSMNGNKVLTCELIGRRRSLEGKPAEWVVPDPDGYGDYS